jgi:general nucleoside transport system ATP-binding protein
MAMHGTGPSADRVLTSAAAAAAGSPAVAAVGITKLFPGIVANDGVTFEANVGEVHALLGENGAGKTTLCNVLTGLYRPDGGELRVAASPVRFRSPRDAHAAGIFMVHQHLRLVESMTVAENVVLGWSRTSRVRFSPRQVEREVAASAERFGIDVNPRVRIWQLSIGQRQRVEILKALYRGARILILDEPTSVLTPQEADQLFASIREMAAEGGTIIFISHKLPEVFAVSDRVTVLRRGRTVAAVDVAATSAAELTQLMVGHEVTPGSDGQQGTATVAGAAPVAADAAPALELSGVSARGELGTEALRDVSLSVRGGEILGIAGVAGNGQLELAEVIAGLRAADRGTIRIGGTELGGGGPREAIASGVAYIPEDRMGTGISPNLSITENLMLKSYRGTANRAGPVLRMKPASRDARKLMERFDVRAPGPGTLLRQLSGGNVQRVLLARELSSAPRVLVAASPTRGLDVAATQDVRRILTQTAKSGVGVLLISEDLDEIRGIADRIAVLYAGRVAGILATADASLQQLGLMMAGGTS